MFNIIKAAIVVATLFFLVAIAANYQEITQFSQDRSAGLVISNNSGSSQTLYSRFIIPGQNAQQQRNSGTMQTLTPGQSITFYLPVGTQVIATDGIYWDNPHPSNPAEKFVTVIKENDIQFIASSHFQL